MIFYSIFLFNCPFSSPSGLILFFIFNAPYSRNFSGPSKLAWTASNTGSISSIVKWGYQDNLKPVYFFFYEKILSAQKCKSTKTNQQKQKQPNKKQQRQRFFAHIKLLRGWKSLVLFVRSKSFLKKSKWL